MQALWNEFILWFNAFWDTANRWGRIFLFLLTSWLFVLVGSAFLWKGLVLILGIAFILSLIALMLFGLEPMLLAVANRARVTSGAVKNLSVAIGIVLVATIFLYIVPVETSLGKTALLLIILYAKLFLSFGGKLQKINRWLTYAIVIIALMLYFPGTTEGLGNLKKKVDDAGRKIGNVSLPGPTTVPLNGSWSPTVDGSNLTWSCVVPNGCDNNTRVRFVKSDGSFTGEYVAWGPRTAVPSVGVQFKGNGGEVKVEKQ